MARIAAVATALPKYKYSSEQIREIVAIWLKDHPDKLSLMERFISSSGSQSRYFAVPAEEILKIKGLEMRAQLFEKLAAELGKQSLLEALSQASTDAQEINNLIFTSCSCPTIPSIDALLVEKANLNRNVKRLPIYQHGCAGGIVGLSIADQLARNSSTVALTSIEICSLVFQPENCEPAQLVGAAIFSDGAATAIIDNKETGLTITDCESFLVPESRELMGYDTFDNGFHLRLDRELPSRLANIAPQKVSQFLEKHSLTPDQISYWLFHPGGIKILDSLERNLNIQPRQCHWARDTLTKVGNLSSASVLFVLKNFLDSNCLKGGDRIVVLGVGPGLTLELILFEYKE